ncbi:MAG TPA: hypothetical protein VFV28_04625 [Limnobacter sp.]|nr:hypothetical protein [Limnobacter sp.]
MDEVNSPRANEYAQETMARLLAMQLIGAGFNPRYCDQNLRLPDPRQPIIGTPDGFQGHDFVGTVVNGLSTRKSTVTKITRFMEEVRELARQYLGIHEASLGNVESMSPSDQLVHRVRLMLLAAEPASLRLEPAAVGRVLRALNSFETDRPQYNLLSLSRSSATANELRREIREARQLTQNRLF